MTSAQPVTFALVRQLALALPEVTDTKLRSSIEEPRTKNREPDAVGSRFSVLGSSTFECRLVLEVEDTLQSLQCRDNINQRQHRLLI